MKPHPLAAAALLLVLAAAAPAHANGVNTHVWISRHALEHLPEGTLKTLLTRPELQPMLTNGSFFPDGGYAIQDGYGEIAHWEPFVEAYVGWLRENHRPPYEGEAAKHIAFLMGVASHGMADQVFDAMFMKMAKVYDAAGWSDELLLSFDTATDVFLVADTGQDVAVEPWFPEEVAALYRERLGYEVDVGTIDTAQYLMVNVVLEYGLSTARKPAEVADYRARYPWASAHLLDATVPGSPPCEGAMVAAYWRALWDRLHGELRPENLVIATVPADGAGGVVTDHARVESQVVVVFGHGIEPDTLPASAVSVVDGRGQRHAVRLQYWGGRHGNLVRIMPEADWPTGEDLTVTIPAGLRTIDGMVLADPWSFRVSTRPQAASPGAPCSDPTPRVGEPESSRPPPGSCGLSPGASRRTVAALLLPALALAVLARRRRRR